MKKCPFCAEEVQDFAVKCKHCHSAIAEPKSTAVPTKPKSIVQPVWYLLTTGYVVLFTTFYVSAAVEYPWLALLIGLVGIWLFPSATNNRPTAERLRQWKGYWQRSGLSALILFLAIGSQAMMVAVRIDDANRAEREAQEALNPRVNVWTPPVDIKPSYTLASTVEDLFWNGDKADVTISVYDAASGKEEVDVMVDLEPSTPRSMLLVEAYRVLTAVDAANLESSIDRVTIAFTQPLTDVYGQEQDVQVMYIRFYRTTWEKIDWENFLIDNIPKVADVYTDHEAIR